MKNKIIIISTILILLVCAFIAIKFVTTTNNDVPEQSIIEDKDTSEQNIIEINTTDSTANKPDEYSEEYNGTIKYIGTELFSLDVPAYDAEDSEYGFHYGYTDNCIKIVLNTTGASTFEIIQSNERDNGMYVYAVVVNDNAYSIVEDTLGAYIADQHLTKEEALERIADKGYL